MSASDLHVVPVNDLIEHDPTEDCLCGPRAELVEHDDAPSNWLYVHHSLDGREKDE